MYLADLQEKLIELARQRVRSGNTTERGLARKCGLSQPHLHNALKHIRALSPEASDRLMRAMNITTADLLWPAPPDQKLGVRGVPFLRSRIGPGVEASLGIFRGALPFPEALLEGLVQPVAARLAPDLVLPPEFAANDIVLLDQSPVVRSGPFPDSAWLIDAGGGLRIRYARLCGDTLSVSDRLSHDRPHDWQQVELGRRGILEVVKARVVWLSRELSRRRNDLVVQ